MPRHAVLPAAQQDAVRRCGLDGAVLQLHLGGSPRPFARYITATPVLVLGATGGVGLAAVQLAKAMGAKVLAGVSSWDKADIARAAGADAVIDLSRPNLNDDLRA